MLAQIIDVFKIRIGVLMAATAVAGFVVTPGRSLNAGQLLLLALAVLGASAAAGAFNQYAERDLDARMSRTRKRAFVTGCFEHKPAWLWGIALLLLVSVGLAGALFNAAVAVHVFLGAFFYGVIYTLWLKRRSVWNIVIGGASGSFAVLAGAAAADPSLNAASLLLAVVLFLWTPPHFWSLAIALHKDYEDAGVPMLPVVYGDGHAAKIILYNTTALVAVSIAPFFFSLGWLYLAGAVIGGGFFLYKNIQLVRAPSPKTAIGCFLGSLVQLTLVLVAAILDTYLIP